MSISTRKSIVGFAATFFGAAIIIPAAYGFLVGFLDDVFNFHHIMPVPVSIILAATALFIGLFWATWAYSYIIFVGKGLPFEAFGYALHPTHVLVTTGPYAYARHPMFAGMIFILLAVALYLRSVSGLVLVPIIAVLYYFYLLKIEEKELVNRFGKDYIEYRSNVPAIIPRLTPYVHQPAEN